MLPCRAGVPFVAVHDSYWTHPCFVNKMNQVRDLPKMVAALVSFISPLQFCREQFVVLHEEPILEDLADVWEENYGGLE